MPAYRVINDQMFFVQLLGEIFGVSYLIALLDVRDKIVGAKVNWISEKLEIAPVVDH